MHGLMQHTQSPLFYCLMMSDVWIFYCTRHQPGITVCEALSLVGLVLVPIRPVDHFDVWIAIKAGQVGRCPNQSIHTILGSGLHSNRFGSGLPVKSPSLCFFTQAKGALHGPNQESQFEMKPPLAI